MTDANGNGNGSRTKQLIASAIDNKTALLSTRVLIWLIAAIVSIGVYTFTSAESRNGSALEKLDQKMDAVIEKLSDLHANTAVDHATIQFLDRRVTTLERGRSP